MIPSKWSFRMFSLSVCLAFAVGALGIVLCYDHVAPERSVFVQDRVLTARVNSMNHSYTTGKLAGVVVYSDRGSIVRNVCAGSRFGYYCFGAQDATSEEKDAYRAFFQ